MHSTSIGHRLCIHGSAVTVDLSLPALESEANRLLRTFSVSEFPPGFVPVSGTISPFNYAEVSRSVCPQARLLSALDDLEVYQFEERYWLLDERWGITEIDLLKNSFRSWVIPMPSLDAVRCAEAAILSPLAQLLRPRGIELLPAVSIERKGWGALILSPYSIQRELTRLIRAGYRVIGQRWTALREEDDGISLLQFPGVMEKTDGPRSPVSLPHLIDTTTWIDLTKDSPWSSTHHARCNAVLIIDPGRRSATRGREVSESAVALRHAWPIVRLPIDRRRGSLQGKLARQCHVLQVQLSRQKDDFLNLIESLRFRSPRQAPLPKPSVQVSLPVKSWGKQPLLPRAAAAL